MFPSIRLFIKLDVLIYAGTLARLLLCFLDCLATPMGTLRSVGAFSTQYIYIYCYI